MTIKQREANRRALKMAVTMVRNADLYALFSDIADDESESTDKVLQKAQDNAIRRIERLIKTDT